MEPGFKLFNNLKISELEKTVQRWAAQTYSERTKGIGGIAPELIIYEAQLVPVGINNCHYSFWYDFKYRK